VVYERIAGGWGRERRYIYWNAHYYGENFYGWSIGDEKSLFESGPFHSQGILVPSGSEVCVVGILDVCFQFLFQI